MEEQRYYISLQGNDEWSGRLADPNEMGNDGPFATFERAKREVRNLKEKALLTSPVRFILREGVYRLSEPLVFGPEDSAPVRFCAYEEEKVVIDGGRQITGWREETDGRREYWVADLPEVQSGLWYFRRLYANGMPASRSRLPKQGHYRFKDVPLVQNAMNTTIAMPRGTDRFQVHDGHMDQWRNMGDIDVVALHFWVEERMPISSFDKATGSVQSTRRVNYGLIDETGQTARYFVDNVFEAMEEPGEWYLDKIEGRLYYIPREGERIGETVITAPVATQLVTIEGRPESGEFIDDLRFEGLSFAHTDWYQPRGGRERFGMPGVDFATAPQGAVNVPGVIRMRGARNCAIQNCTIERFGFYGIELSEGCSGILIEGNTIRAGGAGGLKIDGADACGDRQLRTTNNRITDNEISDCCQVFHGATGILATHTSGNYIAHNHIHHLPYSGISLGYVWGYQDNATNRNIVERNHIHHLGEERLLSDHGGIYTLGVQTETFIRHNRIHDIFTYSYGGWGIYADEGTSYLLIENNIVHDTDGAGFHQHYGTFNLVRNNVFAFGEEGQVSISRPEPHLCFQLVHNVFISSNGLMFDFRTDPEQLLSSFIFSDLNVLWDVNGHDFLYRIKKGVQGFDWGKKEPEIIDLGFADWQAAGHDLHSVIVNPDIGGVRGQIDDVMPGLEGNAAGFVPFRLVDAGVRPIHARI